MQERRGAAAQSTRLGWACLLAIFAGVAVDVARPLADSDLWWHLATGRWIVEHRALLSADPFSFSFSHISPGRELVLNGYWGAQAILYGVVRAVGLDGLIALRVAILLGALGMAALEARRQGASLAGLVPPLTLVALALHDFTGVRPALFSFLLAPLVMLQLDRLRSALDAGHTPWGLVAGLPLTMLGWAALHMGYLLGAALIGLYVTVEGASRLLRRRLDRSYLLLAAVGLAAIGATLTGPNGLEAYVGLLRFEGSTLQGRTSEYLSPWAAAGKLGRLYPFYWSSLLLVIGAWIASVRRARPAQLAVVGFLVALSLSAIRYVPFVLLIALPLVACRLSALARHLARHLDRRVGWGLPAAGLLLAAITAGARYPHGLGATLRAPVAPDRFPAAATAYLRTHRPAGNLLNYFSWGGYLIWQLHPTYKVFIDGRSLNRRVFRHYTHLLWTPRAVPRLLDAYRIGVVLLPAANPLTGERYPIIPLLRRAPGWRLVFADSHSLVFVRAPPGRSGSRAPAPR